MLNYIWSFMIIIGMFIALLNGRIEQTTQAALDACGSAVQLSIGLLGIMCLWTGLMHIADQSGLITIIARVIKPITKILFPSIPSKSKAMGTIVLNMVANLMGLSNAATPLGLKAMNELHKLNNGKDTASNAMCMFVVVNTASAQLIPATLIAIRTTAKSLSPFDIIVPVWICSICALILGTITCKILERFT